MQYRLPKAKRRIFTVLKICAAVLMIGTVAYIMVNGLGLVDGLDFGAGAYYYTDIPGFSAYVSDAHYTSETPMWVLIVLFLAWGFLMYRLWSWIESRPDRHGDSSEK